MTERERLIELLKHEFGTKVSEITADYLLANGVIVPPCKVGDTVYWIENDNIKSGIAWQFGYESHLWLSIKTSKTKVVVLRCDLLYFTKEAAEEALKEREGE